jgi:hypothetical protein
VWWAELCRDHVLHKGPGLPGSRHLLHPGNQLSIRAELRDSPRWLWRNAQLRHVRLRPDVYKRAVYVHLSPHRSSVPCYSRHLLFRRVWAGRRTRLQVRMLYATRCPMRPWSSRALLLVDMYCSNRLRVMVAVRRTGRTAEAAVVLEALTPGVGPQQLFGTREAALHHARAAHGRSMERPPMR